VIAALLLLVQIPGLISRYRLSGINDTIRVGNENTKQLERKKYVLKTGVLHVHSKIGGHSTGTFPELVQAAKKNDLDFVVMTEHTSVGNDTAPKSFSGDRDGVLFLGGHEMDSADGNRYLIIDSFDNVTKAGQTNASELIKTTHEEGSIAFVTHPERNRNLDIPSDGFEVLSLHKSVKKLAPVSFLLDALWCYTNYPELTLVKHFERPTENLEVYDRLSRKKKLSLFASTDAHANLGYQVGSSDDPWLDIQFDPYESLFRIVRTHVLIEKDSSYGRDDLVSALGDGRFFTALDVLGDPRNFSFTAIGKDDGEEFQMGSEVSARQVSGLRVTASGKNRTVILRNGKRIFDEITEPQVEIKIKEPGVYRVEVYRQDLGTLFDKMPWIMSNPIYLK